MPDDNTVKASQEPGVYFINGDKWPVGTRYKLQRLLGSGSFSQVCLATDTATQEQVAVKRIADVLSSPDQARRVLREVCILRRLDHPSIIGLRDVFVCPSSKGPYRFKNGQFVSASIDVYIVMECANGGDLFSLKGQLSAGEVRLLMWQLLHALKYLHANSVWHRDIKSSNILLQTSPQGHRILKVADFGSARSATQEGYHFAEQNPPTRDNAGPAIPLLASKVVMSRGGYTSSLDIWSAGCIFGELLQRVVRVGHAVTPHLQVAPLFAIHGLPRTPDSGETFADGPSSDTTRMELQALFAVIGTPSWADVGKVQSPAWRHYLTRLPGKAPTLYRHFWAAGECTVHLLSRMLAFDPAHRCSAEEALAYEYFAALEHDLAPPGAAAQPNAAGHLNLSRIWSQLAPDGMDPLSRESGFVDAANAGKPDVVVELRALLNDAEHAAAQELLRRNSSQAEPGSSGAWQGGEAQPMQEDAAAEDAVGPDSSRNGAEAAEMRGKPDEQRHYYDEPDPAKALAMLEGELMGVMDGELEMGPGGRSPRSDEVCEVLRSLLQQECAAVRADADSKGDARLKRFDTQRILARSTTAEPGCPLNAWAGPAGHGHLQEDSGYIVEDPAEFGRKRITHVADASKGVLDPAKYLTAGRHGEWTASSGVGPAAGPSWGVSRLPPGLEAAAQGDPKYLAAVRRQQLR